MEPSSAHDHLDEDFIEMDVTSYSNFSCRQSATSPLHPREFEFQMSSSSLDKDMSTSPADELFYEGKLLPLHLPLYFDMVEKFVQHPNPLCDERRVGNEEHISTPVAATTATTPAFSSTPSDSCNISPTESCWVSGDLNLEEYAREPSKDLADRIRVNPKKSWTKKIKLIKHSSLGSKLKASRKYLKSLFGKSGCSDDSCPRESKNKRKSDSYKRNTTPSGQIQRYINQSTIAGEKLRENEKTADMGTSSHRRSFSVSVKWHLSNRVSSSSTSLKPPSSPLAKKPRDFSSIPFLKRSSSAKSEMESPIQGAIAYCKRSQQLVRLRMIEDIKGS